MTIETLALVMQAARYHSRRSAKRVLHSNGLPHANAQQLDQVLAIIAQHAQREQIESLAESMQAAKMEAEREQAKSTPGTDLPEWLIGETPVLAKCEKTNLFDFVKKTTNSRIKTKWKSQF